METVADKVVLVIFLAVASALLTIPFQQAIAKNPKLAGYKLETADDLVQLGCKTDDEKQPEGEGLSS